MHAHLTVAVNRPPTTPLRVKDVAAALDVNVQTVYALVRQGDTLEGVELGRRVDDLRVDLGQQLRQRSREDPGGGHLLGVHEATARSLAGMPRSATYWSKAARLMRIVPRPAPTR